MDVLLNRRSVRDFLDKDVSTDDLKALCYYAEQAPSARNQKSRAYLIIKDKNLISRLSDVSQGTRVLKNAPACIAVIGRDKALLSTPDMQECDLGAAIENMLLKATQMHLGSCWMGICPRQDRMDKCKEILNISDNEFVYSLVAIGYPINEDAFYSKDKKPIITIK